MTPEIQLIAITRSDGGVSIMHFVTRGILNQNYVFEREATDEAIMDEITKAGLDAISWRRIDASDLLPQDRTYRAAWEDDFTSPDGIGGE